MNLLIRPFILSVTGAGSWIILRNLGLNQYIKGDEGAMTSGTVAFLGVAYALFAGFMFVTVWSQWVAVEEAVTIKDKKKFDLHRDKRIPGTAKTLLRLFSLFLVSSLYLIYFQNILTGGFTIFITIMVAATYWEVIMDLDDPFTGVWNVQIPEEWKTKN